MNRTRLLSLGQALLSREMASSQDAQWLLCHVLQCQPGDLIAHPEAAVDEATCTRYLELLRRRGEGEPLAYLIGDCEFWSLTLNVDSRVLIPRPDTEVLVEWGLECLPEKQCVRVADLGTGSGALALAFASERPEACILAVDRSVDAIAVAAENCRRLGFNHVIPCLGDWFEPLASAAFDLIVANPPYVKREDPRLESSVARFEPASALFAGADGLSDLRCIANGAIDHLLHGGWLICEHALDQGEAVRNLFKTAGFVEVKTRRDYSGRERATAGRRPLRDVSGDD